ncbi:response regulator transcription factor [Aquipuribacter sp. MA13-6]|uniref:response regulator transcription factor n=1 Tax=unclassified Aquipuribacter TaxID=2635084 RepID=UPI003EED21EB
MSAAVVLVVDDDPAVRDSLRRSLAFEGYEVRTAADGEQALLAVERFHPGLVVLDLQLPGIDGLDVCRRLRGSGQDVPVLMLTARGGTRDRVTGLDVGADDYLPKPFALEELLARTRALLRRRAQAAVSTDVLEVDDLRLDRTSRDVTRAGRPVVLTRTEFELLAVFLAAPRKVLTREHLMREVWGYDFDPGTNLLEVYVGYLRRKTEAGGLPRLLHNVRGVGYVLRPPA